MVRCRAAPAEHGLPGRTTRVVLATAHRGRDPSDDDLEAGRVDRVGIDRPAVHHVRDDASEIVRSIAT